MNKNIEKFCKNIRNGIIKHGPEILTGIGIAGMLTTTVLAVKGTTKAVRLLDERKYELETDKLTVKETVKTTWKCYIPAGATCIASIACIIGASSVNLRRNAALAAAYKFSEATLVEYRDKVTETIGEKKEKAIREKIVDDKIKDNPVSKNNVIVTGDGTSLCYDIMNDRYFESSYDKIKKAENAFNKELISSDYGSLNDLYDLLNINHVKNGDSLGWNINDLGKDMLEIYIGSHVSEDGRPCLSIDFSIAPKYKFDMYL